MPVKGWSWETIGEGSEAERKFCLLFEQDDRKLVVNRSRDKSLRKVFGPVSADELSGKKLVASRGLTMYRGEQVGCVLIDIERSREANNELF